MRPAASAITMLSDADSRNARDVASLRRSDSSATLRAVSRATMDFSCSASWLATGTVHADLARVSAVDEQRQHEYKCHAGKGSECEETGRPCTAFLAAIAMIVIASMRPAASEKTRPVRLWRSQLIKVPLGRSMPVGLSAKSGAASRAGAASATAGQGCPANLRSTLTRNISDYMYRSRMAPRLQSVTA